MQAVRSLASRLNMFSKKMSVTAIKASRVALAVAAIGGLACLSTGAHAAGRVFYDGFESGNTNAWSQDLPHDRCPVVNRASDGGPGPYSGSQMVACTWSAGQDGSPYQSLAAPINYSNEFLMRVRMRVDKNFVPTTPGSQTKILRFFVFDGSDRSKYLDLFSIVHPGGDLGYTGTAALSGQLPGPVWGTSGVAAADPASWHKVEYYINQSAGLIRMFQDGVKVREWGPGLNFNGVRWTPLYLTSNWGDPHVAGTIYFDEMEVFSDTGTGASGSLADASVSSGSVAVGTASSLRVTGTAP
jgi:hypothetical protein